MANCSALWPPHGVDPLNWWGALAGKLGCDAALERPFLICLRGVRPFELETHSMRSVATYDDCAVLLYRGGQLVFPMSSHAYQVNSKLSPDGVATIKPGRYMLTDLHTGKYPTFAVSMPDGNGHIPTFRDVNHDGIIEHDGSEDAANLTATEILFHGGIDDPPDSPHHFSIGCQCASLHWRNEMVARAPGGLIDYVLIRAEDALPLIDDPLPDTERPNA